MAGLMMSGMMIEVRLDCTKVGNKPMIILRAYMGVWLECDLCCDLFCVETWRLTWMLTSPSMSCLLGPLHSGDTRNLDCHADRSTGDRLRGSSTYCQLCRTSSCDRVHVISTCDRIRRTSTGSDSCCFQSTVTSCLHHDN